MKLLELVKNLEYRAENFLKNVEISSLSHDSRNCFEGSLFFCIEGNKKDGRDFALEAQKNGAVAVVSTCLTSSSVAHIIVEDVRKAMGEICRVFYGDPLKKMKTVAVIGTNGKTTISTLIGYILQNNAINCGVIGTNGCFYMGKQKQTGMTTPDTIELYGILADMRRCGVDVVCIEYSAHAIYYKKLDVKFDIAVFTNCTHDHLDFFHSFEEYSNVKKSIFNSDNVKLAVVNSDDNCSVEISERLKGAAITYGIKNPSDVFAVDIKETNNGVTFIINLFDELYEINSNLIGEFNVYNILAAATVCALSGAKIENIIDSVNAFEGVDGRMQKVFGDSINIYVDYAHTPDGLKNALISLKNIKGGAKLICVFGCGGNRDREKRPIMGAISGEYADFSVITSDNPRFEEKMDIISDIEFGIRSKTRNYIAIQEREQAIAYAIEIAKEGDYILIAGKGCEDYQEIMGVFRHFSDREVACALAQKKYE